MIFVVVLAAVSSENNYNYSIIITSAGTKFEQKLVPNFLNSLGHN